jgi:hypothetical protein
MDVYVKEKKPAVHVFTCARLISYDSMFLMCMCIFYNVKLYASLRYTI